MGFRLKWEGTWTNTYAKNQYGALLQVKWLPSSKQWGIYFEGVLKEKRISREKAKSAAKSWFGWTEPANTIPCTTCGGTGRVRRKEVQDAGMGQGTGKGMVPSNG